MKKKRPKKLVKNFKNVEKILNIVNLPEKLNYYIRNEVGKFKIQKKCILKFKKKNSKIKTFEKIRNKVLINLIYFYIIFR